MESVGPRQNNFSSIFHITAKKLFPCVHITPPSVRQWKGTELETNYGMQNYQRQIKWLLKNGVIIGKIIFSLWKLYAVTNLKQSRPITQCIISPWKHKNKKNSVNICYLRHILIINFRKYFRKKLKKLIKIKVIFFFHFFVKIFLKCIP